MFVCWNKLFTPTCLSGRNIICLLFFLPKANVDVIVVYMHWGKEVFLQPQPYQIHITKHLVSLGVQVIIGSHPHVLQPHCIQGNKLIAYSLGNFLFPPSRTPGGNNPVRVHPVFLKTKAKPYRTKLTRFSHISFMFSI